MLTEPLEASSADVAEEETEASRGATAHATSNGRSSLPPQSSRLEDERIQAGDKTACLGTSNLRALWGMFILNTTFAISQMVGSRIANSLSMFSDSGSMLVDSFVYLINILMERTKNKYGPSASKLWEVYVSVISVTLLVTVTTVAIIDAASRLDSKQDDDTETVDGRFVVGFSLGNLLIDIVMCGNYCYQLRHRRKSSLKEQVMTEAKEQLNMVAAFVHLFADTLRTLTGLIAGILEQGEGANALFIDAVATFIVCALILFAAAFVFYESILQYRDYKQFVALDRGSQRGIGDDEAYSFRSASLRSESVELSRLPTV